MNPSPESADHFADEFAYRLPWPVDSAFPGSHASRYTGDGQRFRGLSPLLRHPDPRRLDLRASLRDPFEQLQVRVMQARSRAQVFVAADLSASMGSGAKLALLRRIAVACAWSAARSGDSFGFAAGAEQLREDLLLREARGLHVADELQRRLAGVAAAGANCRALLEIAALLPRRRALVFLLSDFFLPPPLLADILASLDRHAVVPIVIEQSADHTLPARFGLSLVRDRESGESRLLVLTRALRRRVEQSYARWREEIATICERSGALPFHVRDRFDAARLTDYFLRQA